MCQDYVQPDGTETYDIPLRDVLPFANAGVADE